MKPIPLIILGGADREPARSPSWSSEVRPLSGAKGADVRIGGQPLVAVIVDRVRESPSRFDPLYIAGPAHVYGPLELSGVGLIDTNAGFGRNIRIGIEEGQRLHPGQHLAMMTCDVIPDPRELAAALELYDRQQLFDLWFPLVRAPPPSALGASAWKPRYRLIEDTGVATAVLPGHLAIFDPAAMQLRLVYRLLDLAYRSRNRPVLVRRGYFLRRLLGALVVHDLLQLLRLRVPRTLLDVLASFPAARRLSDGALSTRDLEATIRRLFTRPEHRREHPERRVSMPLVTALSLARDIDTLEEAMAVGGSTPG
jgi:hypothetical protein